MPAQAAAIGRPRDPGGEVHDGRLGRTEARSVMVEGKVAYGRRVEERVPEDLAVIVPMNAMHTLPRVGSDDSQQTWERIIAVIGRKPDSAGVG